MLTVIAEPPAQSVAAAFAIDYRLAFELAPVGLVLSRHRTIIDCNQHLCEMFGAAREQLVNRSFELLYPSLLEFEHAGARTATALLANGVCSDNRVMKRLDGRFKDQTFWCHVTGRSVDPRAPHDAGIWTFEDMSSSRPVKAKLTGREREVAAALLDGLTSKAIGRQLGISHRTVEIYRARLMRKHAAKTTADLVQRLTTG